MSASRPPRESPQRFSSVSYTHLGALSSITATSFLGSRLAVGAAGRLPLVCETSSTLFKLQSIDVYKRQILSPVRRTLRKSSVFPTALTLVKSIKPVSYTHLDNELLVGCLRILTDGYYFGTITEFLVLPEYQKQGVGSNLLQLAKDNTPASF